MAHSKKQQEHLFQNAAFKARKEIKQLESDRCPKEDLKNKIVDAYYEAKWREEDK